MKPPVNARRRWFTYALAFLLTMAARTAAADTLTLMWDRSPDSNVAGYLVYVGTQSGLYGSAFDVGNSTSFAYSSAAPGQAYYFAVAAYFPGPVIGAKSTEVTGTSNGAPVLLNPGTQSSVVGNPVSLQLSGSDPAGQPVSYGVTALPPGLALTTATGRISGTPTTPGSYLVTAVVSDGVLSDSETFTWTVTAPTVASGDPYGPVITITVPTTSGQYNTDQTFVTVGGTATDNTFVTEVTWSTDRGASGRATGTDSWIAGVPISRGPNTITIRARDEAGNVSSKAIVVKSTGKSK
jgi:hypothetical protein